MKGHSYCLLISALGLLSLAQAEDTPEISAQHFGGSPGFLQDLLGRLGVGNGQKGAQKETVTKTMKQTITVGASPTEAAGKNGTNPAAGGVKTVIQTITSGAAQNTKPAAAATVTVTVTAAADAKTVTQVQTITMVQMIACGTTQGNPVPASQASAIASSAAEAASSNAKQPPPAASTPAASTPAAAPPTTASSSAAASTTAAQASSTKAAETSSTKAAETSSTKAAATSSTKAAATTSTKAAETKPATTTSAAPAPPPPTAQPAAASSLVLPVAGGGVAAAPIMSTMDPAGLQGVNNMPINLDGLTLNSNLNLGAIAVAKTPAAFGLAAAPAATTTGAPEPFKLVISK
ncbi:Heterokaryon incompatibility protein 6- OR allele [Apiospora kogelbergensis]|uniref:Heterokaryon incompatibility protein 6- OR allele n=1 Tax=Apiospora kogelbergensis TaxID=1337665 RepID=A0AAW0RDN4_9PEZI